MQQRYAPGMRVEIRDAEWRIVRVDYSSDGGYVLTCEGLSELVQGREALFLTGIDKVRILDPRETELVDDTSSNFGASLLYIDSLLRKTAPSDGRIHLGHRAAIISIDTLKQDVDYRHYLEQAYWDIIIIDEAHNVANTAVTPGVRGWPGCWRPKANMPEKVASTFIGDMRHAR